MCGRRGAKSGFLVSFPPLYCFTKNVAGDNVDVRCLLTTQGPHDFQPQHHDVELARKADLIFINGLGLDEWVSGKMTGNKWKGTIIELAETIPDNQLKKSAEGDGGKARGP